MPAKKELKGLVKAEADTAATTRCDQGLEIITNAIPLQAGDNVNLRLVLCNAAFRVVVHLDDSLIVDQAPVQDQIDVPLPPLTPGEYGLSWSYLTNASAWKVLSEVSVNGVVRFRQRKSSDSNFPFQHSFVLLRVQ